MRNDERIFESKLAEKSFGESGSMPTKAQKFIKLQMELAKAYLRKNPDIKVVPADKGGRVVIAGKYVYEEKMKSFILMNVMEGIYFNLEFVDFRYVKCVCESKYARMLDSVNECLRRDQLSDHASMKCKFVDEPFIMPRIYGLFKVHKDGYPVRPIISSVDCMGKALGKWMLDKLKVIAERVGKHQIKSATHLFSKVEGKRLKRNHVLVTLDFDSMFTNIPFQKTKSIVTKYYHLIQSKTSMPLELFLEVLTFLIEESAFFTFNGEIYLQVEGLSMGNSLSQILAEITTSYFLSEALSKFDPSKISFMFKYVDDILGGVDEEYLERVRIAIEVEHGMKLKMCREDMNGEVDYLQMKVKREEDGLISLRWSQKDYSSKCILDFHSFHPWNMKANVFIEFIRNSLKISSKCNWNSVTDSVRKVLRNSNYPRLYVNKAITKVLKELDAMNSERDEVVERRRNNVGKTFLKCPYDPNAMSFIKDSIRRAKVRNVTLAPDMISVNRNLIFSSLKDKHGLGNVKNASFVVECPDCNFSHALRTFSHDVETTVKKYMMNENSIMYMHCKNANHSFDCVVNERSVVRYKNKYELEYAKNNLLDPNFEFCKL